MTEEHIDLLWKRMTMIYGHKWSSSYGESDDGTWLAGLADVTTEQIGSALELCRVSDDEWPPTLPIFRHRCLPEPAAPYHRTAPTLPPPAKTKEYMELGYRTLCNLRALLHMTSPDEDEAQKERDAIQSEDIS